MATTTTTTPFVMRLIGALAIDPVTYEEVEADRSATGQALLVVVLSSIGAGIGARGLGSGSPQSMVFISAVSLMAWAAWALLTYQIGVKLMPEAGDPRRRRRVDADHRVFGGAGNAADFRHRAGRGDGRRSRSPRCGCWSR